MSATGLAVFDDTLHKTNIWLKEIMDDLGPDRQRAYHALRAVMHTLRDRLTVDEATDLGAQLPMLVRGIYYEGWHPPGKPAERKRDEFIAQVDDRLQDIGPINPEDAIRTVFKVVDRHVTAGEIEDVKNALRKDMRDLWPS